MFSKSKDNKIQKMSLHSNDTLIERRKRQINMSPKNKNIITSSDFYFNEIIIKY